MTWTGGKERLIQGSEDLILSHKKDPGVTTKGEIRQKGSSRVAHLYWVLGVGVGGLTDLLGELLASEEEAQQAADDHGQHRQDEQSVLLADIFHPPPNFFQSHRHPPPLLLVPSATSQPSKKTTGKPPTLPPLI